MRKVLGYCCMLLLACCFSACVGTSFNGSRLGNENQLIMEYNVFNTTDDQDLTLEAGDTVHAEIVAVRGSLSVKVQKGSEEPVYENNSITASVNFDIEIPESGIYTITITGKRAKGSVSFEKAAVPETETLETQQAAKEVEADFSEAFQGLNGCAVLYSPAQEQYTFYQEAMCRQENSPYSTFKIISALSGLQNNVIADETTKMHYNGTVYGNPDWNGDLTFQEAFGASCVWYFRQVIDLVGETEMKEELEEMQYGNCDISEWGGSNINPGEELNGFWLGSSLNISPLGQVKVLANIFEGQSGYDSSNVAIVKQLMLAEENGTQAIYGKTGSGGNGEAWFVGFLEAGEEREYFAVYLNDSERKEEVSGKKAKEIAVKILQ